MNQAEIPPKPAASPPVLEIPADQIEVLPKDASAGAVPEKKAAIVPVELPAKEALPDRATQFYHKLLRASKVRAVDATAGVKLVRVFAGPAEHTMVEGQSWTEAFPNGFDAPGDVFLTAVVRNDGAEKVRASVMFLLEELPGDQQPATAGTRGAPPRNRTGSPQGPSGGGMRRSGGPPGAPGSAGMRRMVPPGGSSSGVRQGPVRNAGAGGSATAATRTGVQSGPAAVSDKRSTGRVGLPQNGPSPRRQENAASPSVISPMVSNRKRLQEQESGKTAVTVTPEAPQNIVLREGEVLVRVEAWRMPALRDLARRGVPLPPTHVGAVQNAVRKRGESAGLPIVLTEVLAMRLLKVVTKGGRMTSEERDVLAKRIEVGVSDRLAPVPAPVAAETAAAPPEETAT